jgi:hypothetical protein
MMNFEVTKFQLNLTTTKLKATSLFLHQALKALLKKNGKKLQIIKNEKEDEMIRRLISEVRQDNKCFETWYMATNRKFPHIKELTNSACLLNYRIMESDYISQSVKHQSIENFWQNLFDHLLQLTFVHPGFFTSEHTYPLEKSVLIIEKSWEDFIAVNVVLELERPSLTHHDLVEHLNALENDVENRSTVSISHHSQNPTNHSYQEEEVSSHTVNTPPVSSQKLNVRLT